MAKKLFTKKNIIRVIAVVLIIGVATTTLKFKKDKDSMSEVSSIIPTGTRITVLQKHLFTTQLLFPAQSSPHRQ